MSRQAKDFTRGKVNNTKGKFNRRNTKSRNKVKTDDVKDVEMRGRDCDSMNDINWYAMSEQLLRDTASMPYSWMTGLAMKQSRSYPSVDNYVVPGILATHVTLTPITLGSAADPINVAARQIVGYIRSKNSGAKNYDANDLMIRILAEGNFLAFLNFAIRIYATANMYSSYNKYMPRDLMRMQSVDPDNIRDNLANFRAALNIIITKAASVVYVPSNLPIFKRWAWLFANYYSDSNNPKDQLYMLSPTGYSHFAISNNTSMGYLQYKRWVVDYDADPNLATLHTWTDIITALNEMLDPLVEDQELCVMTGDMMKAYGDSAIAFQLVPESLTAVPSHDPIVLQQIKSARTCYYNPGNTAIPEQNWRCVVQDANAQYLTRGDDMYYSNTEHAPLYDNGVATTAVDNANSGFRAYSLLWSDAILDSPNPSPTAVDNMENTRLVSMPMDTPSTFSGTQAYVHTAGSEVVEYFSLGLRRYISNNNYAFMRVFFRTDMNTLHVTQSGVSVLGNGADDFWWKDENWAFIAPLLETFDYHPAIYVTNCELVGSGSYSISLNMDYMAPHMRISNYAMLNSVTLEKMNNCALLSLINISGFQPKGA